MKKISSIFLAYHKFLRPFLESCVSHGHFELVLILRDTDFLYFSLGWYQI